MASEVLGLGEPGRNGSRRPIWPNCRNARDPLVRYCALEGRRFGSWAEVAASRERPLRVELPRSRATPGRSGIGASCPLRIAPAKVRSPKRERALSTGDQAFA
jgi:hypothetical protein